MNGRMSCLWICCLPGWETSDLREGWDFLHQRREEGGIRVYLVIWHAQFYSTSIAMLGIISRGAKRASSPTPRAQVCRDGQPKVWLA